MAHKRHAPSYWGHRNRRNHRTRQSHSSTSTVSEIDICTRSIPARVLAHASMVLPCYSHSSRACSLLKINTPRSDWCIRQSHCFGLMQRTVTVPHNVGGQAGLRGLMERPHWTFSLPVPGLEPPGRRACRNSVASDVHRPGLFTEEQRLLARSGECRAADS